MEKRIILGPTSADFIKGGKGSGNFGHRGRPGERGGSSTEGGGEKTASPKAPSSNPQEWSSDQKRGFIRGKFDTPDFNRTGEVMMKFANGAHLEAKQDSNGKIHAQYTDQHGRIQEKQFGGIIGQTMEANKENAAAWIQQVHESASRAIAPVPEHKSPAQTPAPREQIDFVPARTFAEAQQRMSQLGSSLTVKTRGLSEEDKVAMANNIAEGFTNLKNAGFGDVPKEVYISKEGRRNGYAFIRIEGSMEDMAAGRPKTNEMHVRPESKIGISNAEQERGYATGFYSSADKFHTVYHESGHAIHYAQEPETFVALSRSGRYTMSFNVNVAKEVSRYGSTNPIEFVAETFAGMRAGKTYSPAVMDMYKHFKGPEVGKPKRTVKGLFQNGDGSFTTIVSSIMFPPDDAPSAEEIDAMWRENIKITDEDSFVFIPF